MADGRPPAPAEQAGEVILTRSFAVLMAASAVVGVIVSFAAWGFLEGTVQLQRALFEHLPADLGYDDGPPLWYLLVVLGTAGAVVGLAIDRLPGGGGHVPAHGLQASGAPPAGVALLGVVLAGAASVSFGLVLGPEAPLIALGGGLALTTVALARRDVPPEGRTVLAAAGSFAAVSFIFSNPVLAAIILIEATALGGARQRIVLLPGLMAAGIGSLVSIGIGSVAGLSTSDYALSPLTLPAFSEPTVAQFGWAIALGLTVALVAQGILRLGRGAEGLARSRPLIATPIAGLLVALLAHVYGQTTDEPALGVLFSGQDALPTLFDDAGGWAISTLVLLLLFKGLAFAVSLGTFRGGPTFPALFLGAAVGILAGHLPGLSTTAGVAICMPAATVAVLGLPLSAVVLAMVLTAPAGDGPVPLIIVATVVGHLVSLFVASRRVSTDDGGRDDDRPARPAARATHAGDADLARGPQRPAAG